MARSLIHPSATKCLSESTEMAADLDCSRRTVQKQLLTKHRQGHNKANLLYLKFPMDAQKSSTPDTQNLPPSNTYRNKKKKLNERVYDYENEKGECL